MSRHEPNAARALWVRPVPGEPLRYYVRSASRPSLEHLVDLTENGGRGACSCEDFEYRKSRAGDCRHIRLAQRFMARQIVAEVVKLERLRAKQRSPNEQEKQRGRRG